MDKNIIGIINKLEVRVLPNQIQILDTKEKLQNFFHITINHVHCK